MRCPICGSKMIQNKICKYCNITDEQILNASNKQVKQYRKLDMSDLICFSTVVPTDVSRIKLLLLTIFFGFLGINHFYVNRNIRAFFSLFSFVLAIIFFSLQLSIKTLKTVIIFRLLYEIVFVAMDINVILWICDIVNVIFYRFKIPVVLADKGENK